MTKLCKMGFHWWLYNRPVDALDCFPPRFMLRSLPHRQCYCGARQRWLPGYGGSEIGCWLPEDPQARLTLAELLPGVLAVTMVAAAAACIICINP